MSSMQKYRHRQRMRRVDRIVACVDNALAKQGMVAAAVERWKLEMPTEAEMEPRDKYTLFDRKANKYRKGVHSTFITSISLFSSTCFVFCFFCFFFSVSIYVRSTALSSDHDRCRGAQMDADQPASQSAWVLNGVFFSSGGGGVFSSSSSSSSSSSTLVELLVYSTLIASHYVSDPGICTRYSAPDTQAVRRPARHRHRDQQQEAGRQADAAGKLFCRAK